MMKNLKDTINESLQVNEGFNKKPLEKLTNKGSFQKYADAHTGISDHIAEIDATSDIFDKIFKVYGADDWKAWEAINKCIECIAYDAGIEDEGSLDDKTAVDIMSKISSALGI